MEVLSFSLKAKMAHFRKFYSNSSALSYFVPPRTTVVGIIASLLGFERDTYYDDFSLDRCRLAVASCKPIKKNMQKMNYLMIKSLNDLNGSQEYHSQTPLELIVPQDIRAGYVDYKIWMHHINKDIMDKLKRLLDFDCQAYASLGACMSLGSAFNLGWIQYNGSFDGVEVKDESEYMMSSAVPVEKVKNFKIEDPGLRNNYKIIKEELPLEFDKNRRITKRGLKEVLVNIAGEYLPTTVDAFVHLNNDENIVWME